MLEKNDFKVTLETRTSKEGNKYQVLVLKLSDDYEKLIFLDRAEIELLKMKKKINLPFNK